MSIVVPVLLCLALVAFLIFKSYRKNKETWLFNPPSRAASRLKLNESEPMTDNFRAVSPRTPPSDEDFNDYTYRSPAGSERSSTGSSKRRSYEKSYRTHEPLEGVPEVDFEEKPWDLEYPEYEPEDKPKPEDEEQPPFNRSESVGPVYSLPYQYQQPLSSSNPNLVDLTNDQPPFNTASGFSDNSGSPKTLPYNKSTNKSQSSIITEV